MSHPIIPPSELVQQWINEEDGLTAGHIATRAAQWGADKELEACLTEVSFLDSKSLAEKIRATRRPKPQSLKEQALDELHISFDKGYLKKEAADIIRRALEALPE